MVVKWLFDSGLEALQVRPGTVGFRSFLGSLGLVAGVGRTSCCTSSVLYSGIP